MSRMQPKSGSAPKKARIRMRPARRRPIAEEANMNMGTERARTEAIMARLQPRIDSLAIECLARRETHLLFVLDSHSVLMRAIPGKADVLASFREQMQHDTDVVVFPVEVLLGLLRRIVDPFPQFETLMEDVSQVPSPGTIRMFIQIGHLLEVRLVQVVTAAGGDDGDAPQSLLKRCNFTDTERVVVDGAGGPEGYVTLAGFLKMLLHADVASVQPNMRAYVHRFQFHAKGPVDAELALINPREEGDVLMDLFHGEELKAAFDEVMAGDEGALDRALNRVLDELDAAVS